MKKHVLTLCTILWSGWAAFPQSPQSMPVEKPTAPSPAPSSGAGALEKNLPNFDPGSEVFSWNGKIWISKIKESFGPVLRNS